FVKIDKNIATKNELKLIERMVGYKVMSRKYHLFPQAFIELRLIIVSGVVLGKFVSSSRLNVIFGILFHLTEREDTFTSFLEYLGVQVSGIQEGFMEQVCFFQQYRHGVNLFTCRAAGMPYPDKRIGAEGGKDLLPKCLVKHRIPKHLSHGYRDLFDKM